MPPTPLTRGKKKKGMLWRYIVLFLVVTGAIVLLITPSGESPLQKLKKEKERKLTEKNKTDDLITSDPESMDALHRAEKVIEAATIAQKDKDPVVGAQLIKELEEINSSLDEKADSMAVLVKSVTSTAKALLLQSMPELRENEGTCANKDYWDNLYKDKKEDETGHEWYSVSWNTPLNSTDGGTVGSLIESHLPKESKVLDVGCGDSPFSAEIHSEGGYENLHHFDSSTEVVQRMAARYPQAGSWVVEDATNMTYPSSSFDAIIEKGTFDALDQVKSVVKSAGEESLRVLKPDGIFMSISFRKTDKVEGWFQEKMDCTSQSVSQATKQGDVYIHICKRNGKEDDIITTASE